MKKLITLLSLALIFTIKPTYAMKQSVHPNVQKPTADLTMVNDTEDNFILVFGDMVLKETEIKAGTIKSNIKIPLKKDSPFLLPSYGTPLMNQQINRPVLRVPFSNAKKILLTNTNTLKDYFISVEILKHPEFNDVWVEVVLLPAGAKKYEQDIAYIQDVIKLDSLKEVKDGYKIELTLKGDDLAESELDYTEVD